MYNVGGAFFVSCLKKPTRRRCFSLSAISWTSVATITGEPRYIFKQPNLDTKKQLEILDGLITRFRDIANLQPSDMAYQTGMQQLTGQEMDHQLKDISSIFYSAKIRESLLQFLIIRGVVPVSLFILGIICFITGSKVGDSN